MSENETKQTEAKPKRVRGRTGGHLFLRGNIWHCAFNLRGKEIRKTTKQTKLAVAQKFLESEMRKVGADKEGIREYTGTPKQERVLISELLDDAVAEYKRRGYNGLPRELNKQMRCHLKHVRAYFGAMRALTLRRQHVDDFVAWMRSRGKANSTINRVLEYLKHSYRLAVEADPPKLLRVPKIELLEENNVRNGKFSRAEAELIFASVPAHLSDFFRFALETGSRAGEIRKLRWSYVTTDAISVPSTDTKNRKPRTIALTPEIEAILERRRAVRLLECDLIFHKNGKRVPPYDYIWQRACVLNGLGHFYCRSCRDENGKYVSALDAKRFCPRCGKRWRDFPRYEGRLVHDFRRTCAWELEQAGVPRDQGKEITGHSTLAMYERYADLFSEQEKRERQREAQERRYANLKTDLPLPVASTTLQ
jgi:integrase